MSDPNIINSLRSLLAAPNSLTGHGDLLALAQALQFATADQVNDMNREMITAAQARLSQLASMNQVHQQLDDLATVDASTLALGDTLADGETLVAQLDAAGVVLASAETYYISSQTFSKLGVAVGSQPAHIAGPTEKKAAEAGTLIGEASANGDESRKVIHADGSYTVYALQKSKPALTASKADVAAASSALDLAKVPLAESATTDILRVRAYMERNPLKDDSGRLQEARKDETKAIERLHAELNEASEVAQRRALERRVIVDTPHQRELKEKQA